jgi:hypothetical protein
MFPNVPFAFPRVPDWATKIAKMRPFCRVFLKPSSGLEPETPSLPWRFRGGTRVHGRASAATFLLQIELSGCVADVRAWSFVPELPYPSRTRVLLSVLKTHNGDARRR